MNSKLTKIYKLPKVFYWRYPATNLSVIKIVIVITFNFNSLELLPKGYRITTSSFVNHLNGKSGFPEKNLII